MPARAADEGDPESPRMGASHVGSARWFFQSKYKLMGRFLAELERDPSARDAEELRDRYERALRHGLRVQVARAVVTALLAFGVVATVAAMVLNLLRLPEALGGNVETALDRVAAYATSGAAVLLALRLALDRYLERVDVSATFLAMQIAASGRGR